MLLARIDGWFHVVGYPFIHHHLSIFRDLDLKSVQRSRRRAFKVSSVLEKSTAMAWALELVLRRKPARRTTKVGTLCKERIKTFFLPHDPYPKLLFELFIDLSQDKLTGIACFKLCRRLKENSRESRPNKTQEPDEAEESKSTPS